MRMLCFDESCDFSGEPSEAALSEETYDVVCPKCGSSLDPDMTDPYWIEFMDEIKNKNSEQNKMV